MTRRQLSFPFTGDRPSYELMRELEALGRARLSRNFFLRDFLHSEISQIERVPNIPENPALAIENGRRLCEVLLEPLQATFGRIAIRSGYRSPTINGIGHAKRLGCASNAWNAARHTWDRRDANGLVGASACIVIPWFADRYAEGADWRSLAWWIHDHLDYSELVFFPKLCAFNIAWHERPKRTINSHIAPKGFLIAPGEAMPQGGHERWYLGFPGLVTG
ncbi:MAG: hypothetical protein LCH39_04065 [Proteobacteria bacterium]|nr:hypothetical protein [Pseudomonadota bacterium]